MRVSYFLSRLVLLIRTVLHPKYTCSTLHEPEWLCMYRDQLQKMKLFKLMNSFEWSFLDNSFMVRKYHCKLDVWQTEFIRAGRHSAEGKVQKSRDIWHQSYMWNFQKSLQRKKKKKSFVILVLEITHFETKYIHISKRHHNKIHLKFHPCFISLSNVRPCICMLWKRSLTLYKNHASKTFPMQNFTSVWKYLLGNSTHWWLVLTGTVWLKG